MEEIIYIRMDLALNNLQRLICQQTKQTKPKIVQNVSYANHSFSFFLPP